MRLKLLICDDELRICRLIEHLGNWDALEMDVIGFAQNGEEALQIIDRLCPDLVITDIRMPGCTGLDLISQVRQSHPNLEFIIVSGYRQFEYAKSAVQFSAVDYLLKPIDRNELNRALQKAKDRIQQHAIQDNPNDMQNSKLLEKLLKEGAEAQCRWTADEANQMFHTVFQAGAFRVLMLKLDGPSIDALEQTMSAVRERVFKSCTTRLKEQSYDLQMLCQGTYIYLLLNYAPTCWRQHRNVLRNILNELTEYLQGIQELRLTLAIGPETTTIGRSDVLQVQRLIRQRLLSAPTAIWEEIPEQCVQLQTLPAVSKFQQELTRQIISRNPAGLASAVYSLRDGILALPNVCGQDLFELCLHICRLYLCQMRENALIKNEGENFYRDFVMAADHCGSAHALFDLMAFRLQSKLERMIEQYQAAESKPVCIAKAYIDRYYAAPLTLDEVAGEAGFHPSYFCVVFKKETGLTFSEYLSEARVAHAKRLLRETDLKIRDVYQTVGFCDGKTFTKAFQKSTGLKPTEFRKLYHRAEI